MASSPIPSLDIEKQSSRDHAPASSDGQGNPALATGEAELSFDFEFGEGTPGCTNPECGIYPYYGVAPHICFYKRGPEYTIGQSLGLPPSEWPDNFVPELFEGETAETISYPNATGVYYCPDCKGGMLADGVGGAP